MDEAGEAPVPWFVVVSVTVMDAPLAPLPGAVMADTIRSGPTFIVAELALVLLLSDRFDHCVGGIRLRDHVIASGWQDVHPSGLKRGDGFGVRVHSNRQTFARIDLATGGGEGWKVFLKLGPSF